MKTRCPECGLSKEVPEEAQGKKGRCPACGQIFRINPSLKVEAPGSVETEEEREKNGKVEAICHLRIMEVIGAERNEGSLRSITEGVNSRGTRLPMNWKGI